MKLIPTFKKAGLTALVLGSTAMISLPVPAASKLLAMSTIFSVQPSQPPQKPQATYRGRVRPELPVPPRYRQVISESPGYHRYSKHRSDNRYNDLQYSQQPYQQRSGLSAWFAYQAPTTTVINRNVEVIAPQNATSDVYFNQDTYYLYPSSSVPYHPARRYYPPVSRVTIDPQDTENRAKQWTDKTDFNQ